MPLTITKNTVKKSSWAKLFIASQRLVPQRNRLEARRAGTFLAEAEDGEEAMATLKAFILEARALRRAAL